MIPTNSSQRQLRVASLIKLALIEALKKGKVKDLRLINNDVTVTNVTISPDLRVATCYLVPFGIKKLSKAELLDAFEVCKYDLRAFVTNKVALKYSPELRFCYDKGFDNANNVSALLENIGNNSN
jgi:ribosome-binding factor A